MESKARLTLVQIGLANILDITIREPVKEILDTTINIITVTIGKGTTIRRFNKLETIQDIQKTTILNIKISQTQTKK